MISIALCTHNGEKYIAAQLQSILQQTKLPDEIIICDDYSTDNTVEIIKKTFNENFFNNFKIEINNPALKTIKNFERAISLCSGEWIFLSDQDDIWDIDKVEKLLNAVKKNTLLLFSNGRLIDENDKPLNSSLWEHWGFTSQQKERWKNNQLAFQDLLNNKNFVTGATVLFNKKILKNALPIIVPNGYYHDAWLALHTSALDGLHFFEEETISYRIHPEQQVGITKNGKNTEAVFSTENISMKDFKNKIIKQYSKYWLQKKIKTLLRILFNN